MEQKLLVIGKASQLLSFIYEAIGVDFKIMSTSVILQDIATHIEIYSPDLLICCPEKLYDREIINLDDLELSLSERKIPFILLGEKKECDHFAEITKLHVFKSIQFSEGQDGLLQLIQEVFKDLKNSEPPEPVELPIPDEPAEQQEQSTADSSAPSAESEAAQKNQTEPTGTESDPAANEPNKKHILVVDDNIMMLKIIQQQLKGLYNVATAISGSIALRFLEKKTTDLILLDYEMPLMNGAQVLHEIRENPKTRMIPVVFLTGTKDKEKVQEALKQKPQGYLLKPIDNVKLLEMIKSQIGT
ncbi:MAG: response regulator [Treponema sp.]|nr:response regulator [Treponema sp.]